MGATSMFTNQLLESLTQAWILNKADQNYLRGTRFEVFIMNAQKTEVSAINENFVHFTFLLKFATLHNIAINLLQSFCGEMSVTSMHRKIILSWFASAWLIAVAL